MEIIYGNTLADRIKADMKQKIDEAPNFILEGDPMANMDENDFIAAKYSEARMSYWQFTKAIIKLVIKKLIKK